MRISYFRFVFRLFNRSIAKRRFSAISAEVHLCGCVWEDNADVEATDEVDVEVEEAMNSKKKKKIKKSANYILKNCKKSLPEFGGKTFWRFVRLKLLVALLVGILSWRMKLLRLTIEFIWMVCCFGWWDVVTIVGGLAVAVVVGDCGIDLCRWNFELFNASLAGISTSILHNKSSIDSSLNRFQSLLLLAVFSSGAELTLFTGVRLGCDACAFFSLRVLSTLSVHVSKAWSKSESLSKSSLLNDSLNTGFISACGIDKGVITLFSLLLLLLATFCWFG